MPSLQPRLRGNKKKNTDLHSCSSDRIDCSARLRCIDCVPDHVKNDHIITGYRLNYTYWDATKSLFALHNETLNVWSHLLGIILFIYILYSLLADAPTIQSLLVSIDEQLDAIQSLLLSSTHLSDAKTALLESEIHLLLRGWERIRSEFMAGQTLASVF